MDNKYIEWVNGMEKIIVAEYVNGRCGADRLRAVNAQFHGGSKMMWRDCRIINCLRVRGGGSE